MKEKQNILNIIFVAAIIILSVYAVNIQYGIFPETGVEKEKTPIIVKIFVDKSSLDFIRGSKIDFVKSEHGESFKIDNPNVQNSCSGCSGGC